MFKTFYKKDLTKYSFQTTPFLWGKIYIFI